MEIFSMSLNRSTAITAMLALLSCGLSPRPAQAGPLLDWLFGGRSTAPAYPVGTPVPVGAAPGAAGPVVAGYAAGYGAPAYGLAPAVQPANAAYPVGNYASGYAGNYGTYYSTQLPAIGPAGAGYTAPMPAGIAAATLPATMPPTLSYVPNFQTQSQRTPVTYYRPLLTTDPNTGAQVVAMAPCTSYEMMAQRVPVLGRSALFGSNAAPTFQPPSQALPTYTLPSGGIPLAYSTPSITAPYSTAYGVYGSSNNAGNYSALQPAVAPATIAPSGAYPTAPVAQSPYYGSDNGGSCGDHGATPWQPVPGGTPGLVAPQAPPSQYPTPSTPGFSQPDYSPVPNGTVVPPGSVPPGVYPPSGGGTSDPADMQPSLPSLGTSATAAPQSKSLSADQLTQSSQRPQLRSIVRYPATPSSSESDTAQSHATAPQHERGGENRDGRGDVPAMLPIPAPQDFQHEPRWNPGLLREEDMTALRPIDSRAVQLAGHAKPIVWASFESTSSGGNQTRSAAHEQSLQLRSVDLEVAQATAAATVQPNSYHRNNELRSMGSRHVTLPAASQPVHQSAGIQRLPQARRMPPGGPSLSEQSPSEQSPSGPSLSEPRTQRDASGWKASR